MDENIQHTFDSQPTTTLPRQNIANSDPLPIIIDGNARVQIGDYYQQASRSSNVQDVSLSPEEREDVFIKLAATIIELIEYLLTLLPRSSKRVDCGTGWFIDFVHLGLASGTIQSFISIASSERRGLSIENPSTAETILEDVVRATITLAQDLQHTLNKKGDHPFAASYESICDVFEDVSTDQDNQKVIVLLNELCSKVMLSLLIQLRHEDTKRPYFGTRFGRKSILSIVAAINKLCVANKKEVSQLHRSITPGWLSSLRPGSLQSAAESWRLQNIFLLNSYCGSMISDLAKERVVNIRHYILNSLTFPEIDRRYHAIIQAHARTLKWVFCPQDSTISGDNFPNWLQRADSCGKKVFWVSGKPGSGKSTLMRLLKDDRRTRILARTWSGEHKLIAASCFFWSSGTVLQKSLQGLLQTLLHQMLSAREDFSATTVHSHWSKFELGTDFDTSWSIPELRDAIFAFAATYSREHRILVLVDGLDEFEGNDQQRQEICDLLKKLSLNENVKVCVSSRPWNVFEDAFGHFPMLRLELLTRQDIQIYVEQTLVANTHFQRWLALCPVAAKDLINTVVNRASGVFLWVRLVVRSLLEGLQNGDTLQYLLSRVRELPADLEDYFRHIMSRLEACHLEQASQMFEFALIGNVELSNYCFMHGAGNPEGNPAPAEAFSEQDILHELNMTKRRINARCMGLLECEAHNDGVPRLNPVISFLHRTARDFIASQEIRNILTSWRKDPWNLLTALLISELRMIQSCDRSAPWIPYPLQLKKLRHLFRSIHQLSQPSAVIYALHEAKRNLDLLLRDCVEPHIFVNQRLSVFFDMEAKDANLLSFAIKEGATPYVLSALQDAQLTDLVAEDERPLLDCVLSLDPDEWRRTSSIKTVRRLLELGANPNQMWKDQTVWDRFMERTFVALDKKELKRNEEMYTHLIELLLPHGVSHFFKLTEGGTFPCKYVFEEMFSQTHAQRLIMTMDAHKKPSNMWETLMSTVPKWPPRRQA